MYPMEGWLQSWVKTSHIGITQTPTLTELGEYLEQRAQFSESPLSGQLYSLLGPVQFQAEFLVEPAETGDILSPYV